MTRICIEPCRATSKLDARLGLDAGAERVLDERHLGHEIGGLDQLGLGVAAGDDDVQVARLGFQRRVTTSSTGR